MKRLVILAILLFAPISFADWRDTIIKSIHLQPLNWWFEMRALNERDWTLWAKFSSEFECEQYLRWENMCIQNRYSVDSVSDPKAIWGNTNCHESQTQTQCVKEEDGK